MIGMLVIRVPLHSDPIDVSQSHMVFFDEKDGKKRISIYHLFKKKLKFQSFNCLKFCFKISKF